jgi:hypothetical protein
MEHEDDILDPILLILDNQTLLRYVKHFPFLMNNHTSSSIEYIFCNVKALMVPLNVHNFFSH